MNWYITLDSNDKIIGVIRTDQPPVVVPGGRWILAPEGVRSFPAALEFYKDGVPHAEAD